MKKQIRKIGKPMDKKVARNWVMQYGKENPADTRGYLYGRDLLEAMLANSDVEGIWYFKGLNDSGEERLVLFPADKDGNILSNENRFKSLGAASAEIIEAGDNCDVCPPSCPTGL